MHRFCSGLRGNKGGLGLWLAFSTNYLRVAHLNSKGACLSPNVCNFTVVQHEHANEHLYVHLSFALSGAHHTHAHY